MTREELLMSIYTAFHAIKCDRYWQTTPEDEKAIEAIYAMIKPWFEEIRDLNLEERYNA